MNNIQPFENYPYLAIHIARMASTGTTGSPYEWNDFLMKLNSVIAELENSVMEATREGVHGAEVVWGESLRTQFEIEEILRNEIGAREQQKNWESQTEDQRQ